MKRHILPAVATVSVTLFCASATMAQESPDFMPKGGKTLLFETLGSPPDLVALREITAERHSAEEWRAKFAEHPGGLADAELETLADYLEVNMPLAQGAVDAAAKADNISAALPADGRDLAWNSCQFCHSLFTSYLTIDRDAQGWRSTFETPFHREIEMDDKEQETFARYSATNMPMKFEDVPEELRF